MIKLVEAEIQKLITAVKANSLVNFVALGKNLIILF